MSPRTAPPVSYRHLVLLSTELGVYEHALQDRPRIEHGYCTDDLARVLLAVTREPERSDDLDRLAEVSLRFLEAAVAPDGRVRNRRDHAGNWLDAAAIGDWWGRVLAATGFAAIHADNLAHRRRAMRVFLHAAQQRSADVRASSFAAIGAAEVLRARPLTTAARALLTDAIAVIPLAPTEEWTWPESHLRYANATLCEALIIGGDTLRRPDLTDRGLELLAFLLATETGPSGHLSVTGSSGRAPGELGPLWDQQPIEVAAIADACSRAYDVTGETGWLEGIRLASDWFIGANDSGASMLDLETGAGYDGLQPGGRNSNRGAESTLAALTTRQHFRVLQPSAA